MGFAKNAVFKGFVSCLIGTLLAYLSPIPYAYANPVGGNVSAGSATISTSGATETITQKSQNAVIDWSAFNIGGKETTRFVDPNSSSLTVNRVHDMNPSQILGTLSANGNLVLINPNGVFFGQGSKVDVNGIIATASDVQNSEVMAGGKMHFIPGRNPNAAVENQGTITAKDAGLVGLVAPNVQNSGVITAKLGKVQLASGDSFTLDLYGDKLLEIGVSDAVKQQLVQNTGTLEADGGTVKLTAATGRSIVNSLIDVEGEIHAPTFQEHNGTISIYAEGSNAVRKNIAANKGKKQGSSTVVVSGLLDASGYNPGEKGGSISVLGDNVGIMQGAILDASGDQGGGNIKIGGDFHGGGTTPTALNTYVDPNSLIGASVMTKGNGGNVTVWSDGNTWFLGNIIAEGGKQSGNGGYVETSGHSYLDAEGYVDLTPQSATGTKGTYLLDPATIEIYGNVTPAFNATDGSINLSSSLQLWLDASDTSNVTLSYNSMGTTASGTSGANTITVGSNSGLVVGERVQLGGGTHSYAASVNDNSADGVYTITSISGTTVTLDANLGSTYSGATLYGGYISKLTDKSGNGNNATQASATSMPLWISNGQNGLGVANFNGSVDYLSIASIGSSLESGAAIYSVFNTNNAGSSFRGILVEAGNYGLFLLSNVVATYDWSKSAATTYGSTVNNSLPHIGGINFSNSVVNGTNLDIDGAVSPSFTYTAPASFGGAAQVGTGGGGQYFSGSINETLFYNTGISNNAQALVNQYQSAKWGIALTPPGTGATEAAQAMASNGYSVFSTGYLERLSNSANIALSATGGVTLDLQGDNLSLAAGKSLSITAGTSTAASNITFISPGTITTNNAGITLAPGSSGSIVTNSSSAVTLASNGGTISLAGPVSLGSALNVNSGGGAISFGSTVDGAQNLTVNSGSGGTTFAGKIGGTTPLGAVSLTSSTGLTLPSITAASITAQTTGGSADITIPNGNVLTASGTGSAITLVSGGNFINSEGSDALSASNGQWLVYSTNPASDTAGGLSNDFRRFSCTYSGSCPSFPGSGNGFLYSYTPTLTVTPNGLSVNYGDAVPNLSGYAYSLSGYLGSDVVSDSIMGSLTGSTNYSQGSNGGSYNINYISGSLASGLGYGFSYANNARGLMVAAAPTPPRTLMPPAQTPVNAPTPPAPPATPVATPATPTPAPSLAPLLPGTVQQETAKTANVTEALMPQPVVPTGSDVQLASYYSLMQLGAIPVIPEPTHNATPAPAGAPIVATGNGTVTETQAPEGTNAAPGPTTDNAVDDHKKKGE